MDAVAHERPTHGTLGVCFKRHRGAVFDMSGRSRHMYSGPMIETFSNVYFVEIYFSIYLGVYIPLLFPKL